MVNFSKLFFLFLFLFFLILSLFYFFKVSFTFTLLTRNNQLVSEKKKKKKSIKDTGRGKEGKEECGFTFRSKSCFQSQGGLELGLIHLRGLSLVRSLEVGPN